MLTKDKGSLGPFPKRAAPAAGPCTSASQGGTRQPPGKGAASLLGALSRCGFVGRQVFGGTCCKVLEAQKRATSLQKRAKIYWMCFQGPRAFKD